MNVRCTLVATLLALAASVSNAQSYDHEILVQGGDVIDGYTLPARFDHVDINESGTIVFAANLAPGVWGVFTQDEAIAVPGTVIGGKTLLSASVPRINDSGEIVFLAWFDGGLGIFTQSRVVALTGDTVDGRKLIAFGLVGLGPDINNDGAVAYLARTNMGWTIFNRV